MLSLSIAADPSKTLALLVLGAHADDIEIGCGGTLMRLAESSRLRVRWVVFSADEERAREARCAAAAVLGERADLDVQVLGFRDGYFPYEGAAIKESFTEITSGFTPDVVLTHHREDRHQDHRLIGSLTWQTFRDSLILEYEIPKWDGELGAPNAYFAIDREIADRKIELLRECFPSQLGRDWFTDETFRAMLRLRGIECRSPSGYAEAFHARKLLL